MIILAILVVVGVVYSAFAFQLGQAFHQNTTQEMQSLNLAFSQNLGQTNNADLFQIEQTDFKNNIFSSQAQYIVHLGGVETIKLNAKTQQIFNLFEFSMNTNINFFKNLNQTKIKSMNWEVNKFF